MKILIFLDSLNPSGGIERVVSGLANDWKNYLNYDITVLTKDEKEPFFTLDKKIKKISLGTELRFPNTISKFKRIYIVCKNILKTIVALKGLKINDYDYYYSSSPLNTLILVLAGIPPKKIIASEHGSYFGYNRIYSLIKKILYRFVFKVVALTEEDTKLYIKDGAKGFFIPNSLSFFPDQMANSSNKSIINVGRLVYDKGQDMLLEAWSMIAFKYPDWSLKIYGEGELESYLKDKIVEFEISNQTKIYEPIKNIQKEYLKSSIFVLSSRFEGFGMVLVEAMACGLASISFDCPSGPKGIIADEDSGLLIPKNNVLELSLAIEKLIQNQSLRESLGKNGRENSKRFLPENNMLKWKKIFEENE